MTIKTYDVKGELYATYTGVVDISMRPDWYAMVEKFTLKYVNGTSGKLSVQEVEMEVEL